MPRGKRVLTLDKQIEKVNKDIAAEEAKLAELQNKKAELEGQVKSNKISEIEALMASNGITLDDLKASAKK